MTGKYKQKKMAVMGYITAGDQTLQSGKEGGSLFVKSKLSTFSSLTYSFNMPHFFCLSHFFYI